MSRPFLRRRTASRGREHLVKLERSEQLYLVTRDHEYYHVCPISQYLFLCSKQMRLLGGVDLNRQSDVRKNGNR